MTRVGDGRSWKQHWLPRCAPSCNDCPQQLPAEPIQPLTPVQVAQEAVEVSKPDHVERVRQYMIVLSEQIAALVPKREDDDQGRWDEQLVEAIKASTDIVREFTRLAHTIVAHNSVDACPVLYDGFSNILVVHPATS